MNPSSMNSTSSDATAYFPTANSPVTLSTVIGFPHKIGKYHKKEFTFPEIAIK
jgi:hypothetical protein